jgi:hypothetical protein
MIKKSNIKIERRPPRDYSENKTIRLTPEAAAARELLHKKHRGIFKSYELDSKAFLWFLEELEDRE